MRIMIAEDDAAGRAALTETLAAMGHDVSAFPDGSAALAAASKNPPELVISDIRMPGTDGMKLLLEMRAGLPSPPEVILMTGFGDMRNAIDALKAGAYDYILKPINVEELLSVIEKLEGLLKLRRDNAELEKKVEEAEKTSAEALEEAEYFKKAYCHSIGLGQIGVFSESLKTVLEVARKLHEDRSIPVLIEGPTGTGKEVIARYIHYGEGDLSAPFVDINCAAISPSIFESELFGYEAGAFTGGLAKGQKGKFDIAAGGTLFLDEIAEMPIDLQAKLLRVLQEKEFYRIGGLKKVRTNVRIICATNLDIEEKVREGKFRQDLFYRLNVGRIKLLPLRGRVDEIIPLARLFLAEFSTAKRNNFNSISPAAEKLLLSYEWPGNIRELKNVMERVALMHKGPTLEPSHLGHITATIPAAAGTPAPAANRPLDASDFVLPDNSLPLDEFTNAIIARALEKHDGNKAETARYLGISRRSLYCRLKHIPE